MDAVEDVTDDIAVDTVLDVKHPATIAYVGDHIHGDSLASHEFGWTAISIVGTLTSSASVAMLS